MSVAKVIAPDSEELIRERPGELAAAVADLHPADLAELLEDLDREDRLVLCEALPPEQGAAVLSELKGETLRLVLHQASLEKLGAELARLRARRLLLVTSPGRPKRFWRDVAAHSAEKRLCATTGTAYA